MELRSGYKETEIGVIPEDWECEPFSRFVAIQRGHDLTANQRRAGNIPVMGSAGENGFHDTAFVRGPGVVLGRSGASFGQTHWCEVDFWPHNTALFVTDFFANDPRFVFYALRETDFSRHNSGGAQQSLNRNFISNVLVARPPHPEQVQIRKVLDDVDASIAALSRLIAKKRDLRQGAMQRLLTGQTRLPGFTAPWQEKRLGELGDIRSGGTPSTADPAFWDGGIPWCTPTDITALSGRKTLQATARTISARGLSASSAELIPSRSLIMTSRATIGACAINSVPMTTNQGFKNIVPNTETDVDFLYYLMGAQTARLVALCGGSTFLEIGKKQLSAFEVGLPDNKVEQTAIAAVLSDMDAEIDALETRLDKTRALKQGMMQALLTGRIRLPARRDAAPQTKEAAHA